MSNIRLLSVKVVDSRNVLARFTSKLSQQISKSNITISSDTDGVDSPSVLDIDIINDTLSITCQPLVPLANYTVSFTSNDDIKFSSLNGDAFILNDGISNVAYIVGLVESSNPIKSYIRNILANNVYDIETNSEIKSHIETLSLAFSRALYTIGQTKNDNYLSFTVKDEVKTRDAGAFDRLNEEGAYEILRVGSNPTGTLLDGKISIASFPSYLVSLLSTNNSENLEPTDTNEPGSFNPNSITIFCSKFPICKLLSVTFIYNSILSPYVYDVDSFGYQVLESKYDPEHAFTYLSLGDNEIVLNPRIVSDPLFSLENIASVNIQYEYKNNGIEIDKESLSIVSILSSNREPLPPIENIFNLKNAPIVKRNNIDATVGDIIFIDPNAIPGSGNRHPAFLYEINFRFEQLPSRPGEYAVDYSTGTIYVYGEDGNQSGTGAYPPLAVYNYRHGYQENIDYVYDEDENDFSSIPGGSLTDNSAVITYRYERVLVKDIDYTSEVHKESLNERVDNRLVALNAIKPLNFPITNVFRIYNETTGEIYKLTRWNNEKVFFSYQVPPNIQSKVSEKVNFSNVSNEILFVSRAIPISGTRQVFEIDLQNNNIISSSEDSIANPTNTSIYFSSTNIFANEYYWDATTSSSNNISKLTNLGDFSVDYKNGVVYSLVTTNQDLSIGTASYKKGYIESGSNHIVSVNDIYFKMSSVGEKIRSIPYNNFSDKLILTTTFEKSDEQFLLNNEQLPYQISSKFIGVFENAIFTPGVSDYVKSVRGIFERQDFLNNVHPINFSSVATITGKKLSVERLELNEYNTVKQDGYGLYVESLTSLTYLSPNISIATDIRRISDTLNLWDNFGTIEMGSPVKFRLSGINSPILGDSVLLKYSFEINDLSRVIVDYSRGDLFIDYSYLADEIILSYEYGDNVLNFSKSISIEEGDNYYVSYKAGALREALLRNFGTLIDIPILNNLNVDFNRERYRDALMAAMQSFTAGPTIASLRNIVQEIVHTPPDIEESTFSNWSLGTSLLSPEKIVITGEPEYLPGKHGMGILVSKPDDSVTFPASSNLKLEEGTLEMWLTPQWNGIDNQSRLYLYILKNNIVINDGDVFVGVREEHPNSANGLFEVINTGDNFIGMPNKNKNGVFVYMVQDPSQKFNRWCIDIVDGYADGYSSSYTINGATDGKLYDVKKSNISSPGFIRSGNSSFKFSVINQNTINEGITFVADYEHYLFDFGQVDPVTRITSIANIKENAYAIDSPIIILDDGTAILTNFSETILYSDDSGSDFNNPLLSTENGYYLYTSSGYAILYE